MERLLTIDQVADLLQMTPRLVEQQFRLDDIEAALKLPIDPWGTRGHRFTSGQPDQPFLRNWCPHGRTWFTQERFLPVHSGNRAGNATGAIGVSDHGATGRGEPWN